MSDDTLAVVTELRKLRNTAYHDNPVSLYGGMVNLPLIVTRPDGERYFEADVRAQLTGGKYWVEFDAEHSGIGLTERDLRENSFGEDNWSRLDPAARTFIATAEKVYRDHRNDVSFDFSTVLLGFAKAFEVQTNILLKQALGRMRPLDRTINLDGRSVDLASGGPFMLRDLARILGETPELNQALKQQFAAEGEWFTSSLYAIIRELAEIRNPAAHSSALDRETVRKLRNKYIGVGCEGDFVRLAKVRPCDWNVGGSACVELGAHLAVSQLAVTSWMSTSFQRPRSVSILPSTSSMVSGGSGQIRAARRTFQSRLRT